MRRVAVPSSLGQAIAIASMTVCLFAGTASAGPVTLTSLVGDKDHGPYSYRATRAGAAWTMPS